MKFQIYKFVIGYKKKIIPIPKLQRFYKCFKCIEITKNVKPLKPIKIWSIGLDNPNFTIEDTIIITFMDFFMRVTLMDVSYVP